MFPSYAASKFAHVKFTVVKPGGLCKLMENPVPQGRHNLMEWSRVLIIENVLVGK